jgi:hypothetical protein
MHGIQEGLLVEGYDCKGGGGWWTNRFPFACQQVDKPTFPHMRSHLQNVIHVDLPCNVLIFLPSAP